jgi:transcriptional regulator with XRE-family HTH domain
LELCKNIRARRIALKMTQQELAQKVGYKSTSTIAKIESGENDIPHARLAAFAVALNSTPVELLGLKTVTPEQDTLTNIVPCTISKGKPQLKEIIRKLDSLSVKDLNRVIAVIKPLIENFVSDDSIHMEDGSVNTHNVKS